MTQLDHHNDHHDAHLAPAAERVAATVTDPYATRRDRAYKIQQAISLVAGVLEVLLAFRFALRLLAANPNNGFVAFVYGITAPLVAPFVGIFGTPAFEGNVLEPHALVAIVVYALIAWALVKLGWILFGETRTAVTTTTESASTRGH